MSIVNTQTPLGQHLQRVDAESVGLSPARLELIGAVVQDRIARGQIPGAVSLILRHGQLAHLQAHGCMDLESRRPMIEDAIFPLRSMTKPLTTVALLMLYEEGRLRLDDPVARFIPEFGSPMVVCWDAEGRGRAVPGRVPMVPAERQLTVRHLLTHTSGVAGARTPAPLADALVESLRGVPDLARAMLIPTVQGERRPLLEAVKELARVPLSFQPGTSWDYGLSHDVVGTLIEVISGQPLDEYMRTRIFEPLGMGDTFFYVPEDRLDRLVSLYDAVAVPGGWQMADKPVHSRDEYWAKGPRDLFMGGYGLLSSLPDFARFAQMLLNGGSLGGARLLGARTVRMMMSNQTEGLYVFYATPGHGFGLGLSVCFDQEKSPLFASRGTGSWGGEYGTYFFVDPKEEMVGVYSTQVWGTGAGYMLGGFLGAEFHRLAYQALVD